MKLLRCYVSPVLLCGVESWILTEATTKRLAAFGAWLYRRILKTSWTKHVSNEEVCNGMEQDAELITVIKARELAQTCGHRFHLCQWYLRKIQNQGI
ncbi:hypothetical protein Trydic_g5076 [Trypoxylus dichotomus]